MSQIQNFFNGGIGPGGPILTLTGDDGVPVGPNGAGNINILGDNFQNESRFLDVTSGVNTLDINPLIDSIPTNDNTPTSFLLARFTVVPSSAIFINANVIGNRDDYTAACGGFVTGVVRREAAGGPVLTGYQPLVNSDAIGGIATFGIQLDGNDAVVFVRGIIGQDWRWTCTYQIHKQIL